MANQPLTSLSTQPRQNHPGYGPAPSFDADIVPANVSLAIEVGLSPRNSAESGPHLRNEGTYDAFLSVSCLAALACVSYLDTLITASLQTLALLHHLEVAKATVAVAMKDTVHLTMMTIKSAPATPLIRSLSRPACPLHFQSAHIYGFAAWIFSGNGN